MPLRKFEVELDLKWSGHCVLIGEKDHIAGADLIITITKLCVPAVTLYINNKIKFLKNIKQGIKITISWRKYR